MQKIVNKKEVTINLAEYGKMLLHYLWIVALVAVLLAVIGYAFVKITSVPVYESTTKIYIRSEQTEGKYTYTDAMMSAELTKDYEEIVTCRTVLEETINSLKLETSYEKLAKKIAVKNPEDTRIIHITVTDEDPAQAKRIADEVRTVASARIIEVMGVEAVKTIDDANVSNVPIATSAPKTGILLGIIGAILVCFILLLVYIFDDSIKSEEDVERYLKLSTLASIPILNEGNEKSSRKGGKRK